MSAQDDVIAAEARAAELLEEWLKAVRLAEFHSRHGHDDADVFARRADAWHRDYEIAVRDLARASAAAK